MYLGGQGEDEGAKAWFTGQAQYYLGRLEAQAPSEDWLQRLTGYFSSVFPQEFALERARCGGEAEARDQALERWSLDFMAKVEAGRSGD